jgi:hypothetical protein
MISSFACAFGWEMISSFAFLHACFAPFVHPTSLQLQTFSLSTDDNVEDAMSSDIISLTPKGVPIFPITPVSLTPTSPPSANKKSPKVSRRGSILDRRKSRPGLGALTVSSPKMAGSVRVSRDAIDKESSDWDAFLSAFFLFLPLSCV